MLRHNIPLYTAHALLWLFGMRGQPSCCYMRSQTAVWHAVKTQLLESFLQKVADAQNSARSELKH